MLFPKLHYKLLFKILFLFLTLFSVPALAQSTDVANAPLEKQAIPLSPDRNPQPSTGSSTGGSSILPIVGALVIVTGAFLLLLYVLKKTEGAAGRPIPDSVVKAIGKKRIGSYPVYLVAVGKKLVLVAASSNGLTPLTEISDPAEAESIRKTLTEKKGDGK